MILQFTIGLVALLSILSFWRRMHQKVAKQKFKFQAFALRDRLRMLAIEGKISADNWLFKYIDSSISTAIGEAYYLTLFLIVIRAIRFSEDENYIQFNNKLENALNQNLEIKGIFEQYRNALHQYIVQQHYFGFTFFLKPVFTVLFGAVLVKRKLQRYLNSTLYQPNNLSFR